MTLEQILQGLNDGESVRFSMEDDGVLRIKVASRLSSIPSWRGLPALHVSRDDIATEVDDMLSDLRMSRES